MTLRITPDMLAGVYGFLQTTPPFYKWNLPDPDDVVFKVCGSYKIRGYYLWDNGRHIIGISRQFVGYAPSLIETMAHEMIHLHQRDSKMETPNTQHNAAYRKLAERVCRVHGFDPTLFC